MTVTHHLSSTGYTDVHTERAPGASGRPAIEWTRAIIEGAPLAVRSGLTPGWAILGVDLASRHAPDHVLGWPIIVESPDEVVLGSRSGLGFEARLSVHIDADAETGAVIDIVRFRTAIRFEKRGAWLLWAAVAPPHRLIVSRMLRHAVANLA